MLGPDVFFVLSVTVGSLIAMRICLRRAVQGYWYTRNANVRQDLTGKLAVITGGTGGIGLEAATQLAAMGCNIVLLCRGADTERVAGIVERIKGGHDVSVRALEVSLDSFASTRHAADELLTLLKTRDVHIDYLLLNAGLFKLNEPNAVYTEDNVEETLQTNYYSHFLLLQLLKQAGETPKRVVSTSSGMHRSGFLSDILTTHHESNVRAYGSSKRAQMFHMIEEAARSGDGATRYVSCTPGLCGSGLFARWGDQYPVLYAAFDNGLKYLMTKTSWEGSQVLLFCLLSPAAANGEYYNNCCVAPKGTATHPFPDTPTGGGDLWTHSMKVVGL